jgi:transcriptional regulator with XRE-family HTH domain
MAPLTGGPLGEFLREQRRSAQMSLRQLAEQAGVSNPYLSQIERGVRKPSAEILQQIAKGLRISAEQLYVHAGILDDRPPSELAVESAVMADPSITERQKRVVLEIYRSFRSENSSATASGTASGPDTADKAGSNTGDATAAEEAAGGTAHQAADDAFAAAVDDADLAEPPAVADESVVEGAEVDEPEAGTPSH